jgi:hypothetical protein
LWGAVEKTGCEESSNTLLGDAISAVYRLGWINRARILACRAKVGPRILSIYLADHLPNGHNAIFGWPAVG